VKLSAPLRIRWDMDPPGEGHFSKSLARALYRKILDAAPLLLEIRVESRTGLSLLREMVKDVSPACALLVFLGERVSSGEKGAGLDGVSIYYHAGSFFSGLTDSGISRLWMEYAPWKGEKCAVALREFFSRDISGVFHLVPPNLRKMTSIPDWNGKADTRRILQVIEEAHLGEKPPGRLVVHDYFLWKSINDLYPRVLEKRGEFEGCQGGDKLAYVDWEGTVYPCETFLVPLGRIVEKNLEEIWVEPGREELVDSVRKVPHDCEGCELYEGCFGGCRGYSHHFSGGAWNRDPQCER